VTPEGEPPNGGVGESEAEVVGEAEADAAAGAEGVEGMKPSAARQISTDEVSPRYRSVEMVMPASEAVALVTWPATSKDSCALRYSLSVGPGEGAAEAAGDEDAAFGLGPDEHPAASEIATTATVSRTKSDFTSTTPHRVRGARPLDHGWDLRRARGDSRRLVNALSTPAQPDVAGGGTGRPGNEKALVADPTGGVYAQAPSTNGGPRGVSSSRSR